MPVLSRFIENDQLQTVNRIQARNDGKSYIVPTKMKDTNDEFLANYDHENSHSYQIQDRQSKIEKRDISTLTADAECGTDKNQPTTSTKCILKRLTDGESQIEYVNDENVVLVLGNTGAGKSTFVQYLAGNNSNLISEPVKTSKGIPTGDFTIVDKNNKIGNSNIISQTEIPELVIDDNTKTKFYDCPGFSDSRNAEYDISGTYFTKKVADKGRAVKLLFIVNYSSVKTSGDKLDFKLLAKHATDMIKDVRKFKDAIGIVASKVNDDKSDEQVIATIATYLEQVLSDLKKMPNQDKNTIEFVSALLEGQKNYERIGFIRQPKVAGPISEIKAMQDHKKTLQKLVYENLKYVRKDKDDFSYTLSDKSINFVDKLLDDVSDNIWSESKEISNKIDIYYRNIVEEVNKKMKSFISSTNSKLITSDSSEAEFYFEKLSTARNVSLNLVEELKKSTPGTYVTRITKIITEFEINYDATEKNLTNLTNQAQYLDFLMTFVKKTLPIEKWANLFQGFEKYVHSSLNELQSSINTVFEQIMKNIASTIKKYYDEKMQTLKLPNMRLDINKAHLALVNVLQNIKKSKNTEEIIEIIQMALLSPGLVEPLNEAQSNQDHRNYLKYLHILKGIVGNTTKDSDTWLGPFEELEKYLALSHNWLEFMEGLYLKFSEYTIQQDTTKYNVANLADWGESAKSQGISVTKDNVQEFLSKVSNYKIKGYDNIKNISNNTVTSVQLKTLNDILSWTLKPQGNKFCPPSDQSTLNIQGYFVKFSDFVDSKRKLILPKNGCNDIKALNVFALDTVFFDKDFDATGYELQVSVIAPKWEVIGKTKITLDGKSGESYSSSKAPDGTGPGNTGNNGKPGQAGSPGGSFFGIGDSIKDAEGLTISTSGGLGGTGQQGGDGVAGRNGPECSKFDYSSLPSCRDGTYRDFQYSCSVPGPTYKEYYFYGLIGSTGGNGGDGGKGGRGGNPGTISVLNLGNNINADLNTISKMGEPGSDGSGGSGAGGGLQGRNLRVTAIDLEFTGFIVDQSYIEPASRARASSGSAGVKGKNTQGQKEPSPAKIFSHPSHVVNSFKGFVIENLSASIQESTLQEMMQLLHDNPSISAMYDTLGLVNELQTLESRYFKLYKIVPMLPFYENLLTKISSYANKLKDKNHLTAEDKKVLGFLYTATLSKICTINANARKVDLIVNITGYLDAIAEEIKLLQETFHLVENQRATAAYNQKIEKKIEEANQFIEQDISKEIEKINLQTDELIKKLVQETINKEEIAKGEEEALREKQNKLMNHLLIKKISGVLQVGSLLLSFAGPVGAAVGTVIGAVSMVADSFTIDNSSNQGLDVISALPSAVKTVANKVSEQYQKQQAFLGKELTKAREELDKVIGTDSNTEDTTALKEITKKIDDMKNKMKKGEIVDSKDLEKLLKDQIKSREKKKNDTDKKIQKRTEILNRLRLAVNVGETMIGIFKDIQSREAKIANLANDIETVITKYAMLREYEESIYKIIIPLINDIGNKVANVAEQLRGASHSALDVSKWKMQTAIRDVQIQIAAMTKGFSTSEDLVRCVENLDYGMSTMIQIFDRIQDYRDQAELADYITNISGPKTMEIQIANPELKSAISSLQLNIKSNLVLGEYEVAMDAFRQYIFPFAYYYLEEYNLPSSLKMDSSDSTLEMISVATTKIKAIRNKLAKEGSSIVKDKDPNVFPDTEFKTGNATVGPFFIWNHNSNNGIISNLLQGKEVTLRADILRGSYKNAIKFNEIGVRFRMQNESLQGVLDKELQYFQLEMTHLGLSYYKCKDKYYSMSQGQQKFTHSVNKNNQGKYSNEDQGYIKLKENYPLVSPYTMWRLKLKHLNNRNDANSFQPLAKFRDQIINLELEGHGAYVDSGAKICETGLEKYYILEESVVEPGNPISYKPMYLKSSPYLELAFDNLQTLNRTKRLIQNTFVGEEHPKAMFLVNELPPDFTISSAKSISSPINTIFNWVSGGMALLSVFDPSKYMKNSAKLFYGNNHLESNRMGNESTYVKISHDYIDMTSFLTLADFATRYFTREKPIYVHEQAVSYQSVRALTLDIVTDYEKLLDTVTSTENNCEFHPVSLISSIEKEIINGNYKNLGKILYNELDINDSKLKVELKEKISIMLDDKLRIHLDEEQSILNQSTCIHDEFGINAIITEYVSKKSVGYQPEACYFIE